MSVVVWYTGLPSSGKTTLAKKSLCALRQERQQCCLLDSDELREALVPAPGYDAEGRHAFYSTTARLAGMMARQGLVTLVAATANLRKYRELGRKAAPAFVLVYVATPIEECRRRDSKGLYERADAGELSSVPGAGAPYEAPVKPDVIDDGSSKDATVAEILARVQSAARVAIASRQGAV